MIILITFARPLGITPAGTPRATRRGETEPGHYRLSGDVTGNRTDSGWTTRS